MALPIILLTGSTGFLGKALLQYFVDQESCRVVAVLRTPQQARIGVVQEVVGEIDRDTSWSPVFQHPVDTVVHAAARAHIMKDSAADPLSEYRRVNVEGTLNLARCAAAAGVKRFVFISSIKVNGEFTQPGMPFLPDDRPNPADSYGLSKLEAESGLWEIQRATGMEVVVIRPVLVYGPGVKANFLSMIKWLNKRLPLPFGAIRNARSLVSLDNAVSFIALCTIHPNAANETFLVSDGADISTTCLLRQLSSALGKKPVLVPIPQAWLMHCASVLGLKAKAQRLLGSLQVDIEKNTRLLGWLPPGRQEDALRQTARRYLESTHR